MIYLFLLLIIFFFFWKFKKKALVIKNGNIIFKNLDSEYGLEELIKSLIKNDISDISDIEEAYYFWGQFKYKTNKPYILIFNGKIDYESLIKINKTPLYVLKFLKEKSLKLEEILYAIYLNKKLYIVKN